MGEKLKIIILLSYVIRLIVFVCGVAANDSPSHVKVLEVERKLELLKKGVVKSIFSEDGDIIDCVDIYKQPAFDHPALKNHKIQMAPSFNPTFESVTKGTYTTTKNNLSSSNATTIPSQRWQRSGSCPNRTIPIRRIRKDTLLKAKSVEEYGRKSPDIASRNFTKIDNNGNANTLQPDRSIAILIAEGYRYIGAKGDIKTGYPFVEPDDYSTSQVALKNGPYYKSEIVEAGWAVNPKIYGDSQTRMFVYWTADSSKTTGCFDLTCPGFIQIGSKIALGAAIDHIKLAGKLGEEISVYVYKDESTNNWWVQIGQDTLGYYPPQLFESLKYMAVVVEWGGEVYSTKVGPNKPHTKTQMGNGQNASPSSSGYIKRLRVRQNDMQLRYPEWVTQYVDEYDCYSAQLVKNQDPEFYYGGDPAYNWRCPCEHD